ncbi:phosphatidylserine decarboxylase [Candidatus Woesearchaeota archaeon]|nr:phosphatidylserine decarboxylase [Candidatus Woesearchaeota archaeon]
MVKGDKKVPIVWDGIFYSVLVGAIGFGLYQMHAYLGGALFLVAAFILYFFRDPNRISPKDGAFVLSPADGKIIKVKKIIHPILGKGKEILIRLSLLDVHVNRSPIQGKLTSAAYEKGKKFPVVFKKSPEVNERNSMLLKGSIDVEVTQIAGIIGRRIVQWINIGDSVNGGDRIGMIKFGSMTSLFVPSNVKVQVSHGDRVKSGKTILGIIE